MRWSLKPPIVTPRWFDALSLFRLQELFIFLQWSRSRQCFFFLLIRSSPDREVSIVKRGKSILSVWEKSPHATWLAQLLLCLISIDWHQSEMSVLQERGCFFQNLYGLGIQGKHKLISKNQRLMCLLKE